MLLDYRFEAMEPARLVGVHNESRCEGGPCAVHNRSVHSLRTCPQWFDNDTGVMFRICPCGNFHIDPDERAQVQSRFPVPNCRCRR